MAVKVKYVLLYVIVLISIGCTSDTNGIRANEVITPQLVDSGSTPTSTISPAHTFQPTSIPALDTPTPTPISVTATLRPTLTVTPANAPIDVKLTELLLTNGGCELPCWWELIPGESTIETAKTLFNAPIFNWWDISTVVAIDSRAGTSVILEFQTENSVINMIGVGGRREGEGFAQAWQNYDLYELLNRYGKPSSIYVYYPWRPDSDSDPMYRLFLFYETLGIEINYLGQATETNNDGKSTVCPDLTQMQEINMVLYQTGQIENIVKVIIPPETISFIAEPDEVYDLIEWSSATGTSIEMFYETFKMAPENGNCFEFMTHW